MTFTVLSVLGVLVVAFLLSYHRFRRSSENAYFPWLGNRMTAFVKVPWTRRIGETYRSWFVRRYPSKQRWIYLGLAVSCTYLVLSGLIFAWIKVRLFGLALLGHVVLGGVFAVCLAMAVVMQARFYTWNAEEMVPANLKTEAGKRKVWQIVLFWILVASGLVLIVTALFQMLPQFTLRSQLLIFDIHRYAALGILLAGMAFTYFSLIDETHEG